ncbi:MAG TPA: Calx-beta domain-containing protein [Baekduia sp.]|uniref:Calx-beta domain-containing protein n=1 Tax=Baekduia sp. TaxID=2600305 RepID=UPI002D78F175|nr:Calx-beta domain-containing protein [Baekduia sp.]HET6506485.1 Calx-beta domain-containing protein [Baekduia sp.]
MSSLRPLAVAVLALAVTAPGAAASVSVDPSTRTVTTPRLTATFDATNPEQLTTLRWLGIGDGVDLAADGGVSGCGDAQETWGQSYAEPSPRADLVAAGSRGTWQSLGDGVVRIDSQVTEDGCDGNEGRQPVQTTYRFTDGDQFAVTRRFAFDPDEPAVFTQRHLRPYVPRMPRSPYSHTLWPSDTGYNDSVATTCNINFCARDTWTGTWYAQDDPDSGRGLLVLRAPSTVPARLLIDNDTPSVSNSSSADLVPTVFDGPVTETEYLCFYTDQTWPVAEREAARPPAWCGPSLSIAGATVSEADGVARLTVTRSLVADPAPTFSAVAEDGTAKAGSDYGTPVAETFAPGAATARVTVPIVDDDVHEDTRSFTVRLADVSGATIGAGSATVTILDDDPIASAPPPATDGGAPPPTGGGGRPATKLRASRFVSLPATRSCPAKGPSTLRIRLLRPKGHKITRAVVKLDGKVVKTVRGTGPITIHRLPKGKVTVSVAVRTTTGAVVTAAHAYRACAAAPATR